MSDIVCMQCRYHGPAKRKKPGSTKAEFLAWLLFPFGLPYTLWRMLAKRLTCRQCYSEFIVPADSPAGQRLIGLAAGENVAYTPAPAAPAMTEASPPAPVEKKERPRPDPNAW